MAHSRVDIGAVIVTGLGRSVVLSALAYAGVLITLGSVSSIPGQGLEALRTKLVAAGWFPFYSYGALCALALLLSIRSYLGNATRFGSIRGFMLVSTSLTYIYALICSFALVYYKFGLIDTGTGKETHDLSTCLYFSLVNWTTLGYGDFRPTVEDRLFAASEAMLGYVAMALFLATLVAILSKANAGDVSPGRDKG